MSKHSQAAALSKKDFIMKKELKDQIIESISAQLKQYPNFYVADIEGLNAENTVKLRRACFEQGIKLTVVKNTLFAHVLKTLNNEEMNLIIPVLKGNTAIMYAETPNGPAKLIKKLQKEMGKPQLKGAYVQECAFVGAENSTSSAPSSPGKNSSETSSLSSRLLCAMSSPLSKMAVAAQSPDLSRHFRKRREIITNNLININYGRCKSTCRRVG